MNWYLKSKNYSCLITVLTAAETQAFTLFKKLMRNPKTNTKRSVTKRGRLNTLLDMFFTRKNCKQEKQELEH